MHKLTLLLAMLLCAAGSWAIRAKGGWHDVRQPDGTTLRVTLCGDEWMHCYMTTDGVPLVLADDGRSLCYADCWGFALSSTGVMAHEAALRTDSERLLLQTTGALANIQPTANTLRRAANQRRALQKGNYVGQYKGLVVLVDFPDRAFSAEDPQRFYHSMLNDDDFAMNDAPGSVRNYFLDQSEGLFDVSFDVVGPVTVSKKSNAYYTDGTAYNVRRYFVPEVVRSVATQVDLKDYDWNGDGEVEQIVIIYAGYTSSDYYPDVDSTAIAKDCIWPHEWTLATPMSIDGMRVYTYACSNELWIDHSLAGFGTLCHEFSHCLGLPDLYDTNFDETVTFNGGIMDKWDIMDGGNYCHGGWVPAGYSGYERIYCGWRTPTDLDEPQSIRGMKALNDGGPLYTVTNDCATSRVEEFYVLENRQKQRWDRYLPGHGLLVTHVDYNATAWANNTVNDDLSHLRQVFIPADNDLMGYYRDMKSPRYAAYPYVSAAQGIRNDSLTNHSSPAATVYNVNRQGNYFMNKPITRITEEQKLVGFDFMGGTPSAVSTVVDKGPSTAPDRTYDLSGRTAGTGKAVVVKKGKKYVTR